MGIHLQNKAWEKAVEHSHQAWLAANETGDVVRMMHTAHNIGMMYARLGRFQEASSYLERSLDLATELGNRQIAGLSAKTIGGSLFMAGQFAEAEKRYQEAYAIFVELGNHNWQAHTCYDLAEVYAELGDMVAMQRHFEEGIALAREAGDEPLVAAFEELGRNHQSFFSDLNPRQLTALNHARRHGKITNRQYQDINEVSPRQALRDLQELEEAGMLIKTGKGRATHYKLPTQPE